MSGSDTRLVAALRRSVLENDELRATNQRLTAALAEPIAIVGAACRLPGGVASRDQLWDLVADRRDTIGEFPIDRGWDPNLYDPDPEAVGRSYVCEGGFLYDAGDFDAGFFGIGPREARATDPQQRLLLEVSWEALEDARLDPNSLRDSDTGVFVGAMYHDYGQMNQLGSIVSGRIAYSFGLTGPAVTIDTACSSSLVALHQAVAALRAGECGLALVGGVSVMATPGVFVEMSRQRGLSRDGRCKSYAAAAEGVGWSEGAAMLVVERLSSARRNGRRILAVVRGSAVNQDGTSNGLTAPNGPAQERVIQAALANAGLGIEDVDVVEGHGTGTTLGDPIEARALVATYGRKRDRPLWLGSIKSNIGHTQAAAGVTGVIKMAMAMRHQTMPSTLHVDAPSPHVDWSAGTVRLLTEPQPWPSGERPRRAAVSSFGISGTNAHVILEEPPAEPVAAGDMPAPPVVPWVISGKTAEAVTAQADRIRDWVVATPEAAAADVGVSLADRARLEHRTVVLGTDRTDLLAALAHPIVSQAMSGKTAFAFPGQGSQRVAMGRRLHAAFPVFRTAFDDAVAAVEQHLSAELRPVLWGVDEQALTRTMFAQSGLFAVEVALAALLESWGVRPDLVLGHSVGEVVAAHVAGVLTLDGAAKVVAARGTLMQALPTGGAMLAVAATAGDVLPLLPDGVEIAAVNGPAAVVLSGDADQLATAAAEFARRDWKTTTLSVSHAFHSAAMDSILDEFTATVADITVGPQQLPVVSNLTGEFAPEDFGSPQYWRRHLRQPVLFADGVATAAADGAVRFVEVGPGAALTAMIAAVDAAVVSVPLLRGAGDEVESLVAGLGRLDVAGGTVDWTSYFAGTNARRVDLPLYPFQRERFWAVSTGRDMTGAGLDSSGHPLVAAVVASPASGGVVLTGRLSLQSQPWLAGHRIFGRALLPGAGFAELLMRAGDEVDCSVVQDMTIRAPLPIPETGGVAVQVVVDGADTDGRRAIAVYSRRDHAPDWALHAEGTLVKSTASSAPQPSAWPPDGAREANSAAAHSVPPSSAWPPDRATALDVTAGYEHLAERGYGYGPAFRGVQRLWRLGDEIFAEAVLPSAAGDPEGFGIHPALLDAVLHAGLLALRSEATALPFAWQDVALHAVRASTVRVRISPTGDAGISVLVTDEAGRPVFSARRIVARPISLDQLNSRAQERDSLFRIEWRPVDPGVDAGAAWQPWEEAAASDPVAPVVVVRCAGGSATVPAQVRATAGRMLTILQAFLSEGRFADSHLVVLTHGAVALPGEDIADLAAAAAWGLVRAAQAEQPGRIMLADVEIDAPIDALVATDEPEIVIRAGRYFVPRLVPVDNSETAGPEHAAGHVPVAGGTDALGRQVAEREVRAVGSEETAGSGHVVGTVSVTVGAGVLGVEVAERVVRAVGTEEAAGSGRAAGTVSVADGFGAQVAEGVVRAVGSEETAGSGLAAGTVLVTGGTGALGAQVAEHLVRVHGARHLLLVGRRGAAADGADELLDRLRELGADADIAACDAADRDALRALLSGMPATRPLVGVVHAAGVLDDGVLGSLTDERLDTVFAAKVDGAWHLHELTEDARLELFVLFSSVGGLILPTGQGGYAAANVFLDALAAHRRAAGLPATSLAWGPWEDTRMGLALTGLQLQRIRRSGVLPLAPETAMRLFDAAATGPDAVVMPAHIDRSALRRSTAELPALLRGLVPAGRRRAESDDAPAAVRAKLAAVPSGERRDHLIELMRRMVADVLGHGSASDIDPETAFSELGFDSLAAIELRNKLRAATGLNAGVAVVFDYPTVTKLSGWLAQSLGFGDERQDDRATDADIRKRLATIPIATLRSSGMLDALLRLATPGEPVEPETGDEPSIDEMDSDELIRHILTSQQRPDREQS
ncbi:type I polyketide synthase [Nocardia sp. NPDC052112]|uniref:type I polyketide synthase n=1 Tax=Nocardia sp. NPDC052112 TaxID=3155646 RepID=UPI00343FD2CD